jgi:hypothetical protein
MRKSFPFLCLALLLCGCAGGPPHDYYNASVANHPKFKGPAVIEIVEDVEADKGKLVSEGYTQIGVSDYYGRYPEAIELRAQARRAGANKVIYSCRHMAAPPGAWEFSFNRFGGGGGTVSGQFHVRIYYLGK